MERYGYGLVWKRPKVRLTNFRLDLYRRDFTINALAISLNTKVFGDFWDFFGGASDIRLGIVRTINNIAFWEDPFRILRAIRFEQELGFRIGYFTEKLIWDIIKKGCFQRLSLISILRELRNVLGKKYSLKYLKRLNFFKILKNIHVDLEIDKEFLSLWKKTEKILEWYILSFSEKKIKRWIVLFLVLFDKLDQEDFVSFFKGKNFFGKIDIEIVNIRLSIKNMLKNFFENKQSFFWFYKDLCNMKIEFRIYMMAKIEEELLIF